SRPHRPPCADRIAPPSRIVCPPEHPGPERIALTPAAGKVSRGAEGKGSRGNLANVRGQGHSPPVRVGPSGASPATRYLGPVPRAGRAWRSDPCSRTYGRSAAGDDWHTTPAEQSLWFASTSTRPPRRLHRPSFKSPLSGEWRISPATFCADATL